MRENRAECVKTTHFPIQAKPRLRNSRLKPLCLERGMEFANLSLTSDYCCEIASHIELGSLALAIHRAPHSRGHKGDTSRGDIQRKFISEIRW